MSNEKYGFALDLASQVYESYRVLHVIRKKLTDLWSLRVVRKLKTLTKIEDRSLWSVIAANQEKKVHGLSCDVNWSLVWEKRWDDKAEVGGDVSFFAFLTIQKWLKLG